MAYGVYILDRMPAGTGGPFTASLVFNNLPLSAADLATLKMTIFRSDSGLILNSRDDVDVKSSLGAGGVFTFELTAEDNALAVAGVAEEHGILLRAAWTDPATRKQVYLFYYTVDPIPVPAVPPP